MELIHIHDVMDVAGGAMNRVFNTVCDDRRVVAFVPHEDGFWMTTLNAMATKEFMDDFNKELNKKMESKV
jgi:hypothetical protein